MILSDLSTTHPDGPTGSPDHPLRAVGPVQSGDPADPGRRAEGGILFYTYKKCV